MVAMTDRVRQVGNTMRKRFERSDTGLARRVMQYADYLSATGVRTPAAMLDTTTNELVADWIEGATGWDCLRTARVSRQPSGWRALPEDLFKRLLEPVATLHAIDPCGLNLEPLDIWRRITPRLEYIQDFLPRSETVRAQQLYSRLRDMQALMDASHTPANVAVHGDYHVGQLLFDRTSACAWLLDLDDLALGVPESDIGNFIAHLSTSADLTFGDVFQDFMSLEVLLSKRYTALCHKRLNPVRTGFYGAVALLRRALKLGVNGVREPAIHTILDACEILAESIHFEGDKYG
jgi:aminoglycoside phosphotransferase (APT) family kinase protein